MQTLDVAVPGGITRAKVGGNASPLVVFLSGLGDGLQVWAQVAPAIAPLARVLIYDRLGIGRSTATSGRRDASTLAAELHELLVALKESEPVLLVAHSFGAFIARAFAAAYPGQVAALCLVEPSHEDWLSELKDRDAHAWKAHLAWRYKRHAPGRKAELAAWDATLTQMRQIGTALPEVPTTFVSAVAGHATATEVLFELHRRWASALPQATHLVSDAGGHYLHRDAPEIVIDAITDLVRAVNPLTARRATGVAV